MMKEKIRILVRMCPMDSEAKYRRVINVSKSNPNEIEVQSLPQSKAFCFDKVMDDKASQEDIFNEAVPFLESAMTGHSCCILMYGQTSTGKTYTMLGYDFWTAMAQDHRQLLKWSNLSFSSELESHGIIPRTMKWLLSKQMLCRMNISVSYVEIYNDHVFDLLSNKFADDSKSLDIREDKGEIAIVGCTKLSVNHFDDVLNILWDGAQSRSLATTDMNEYSSRSHTIFIIYLDIYSNNSNHDNNDNDDNNDNNPHQNRKLKDILSHSKIQLVDLAGSEKWKPESIPILTSASASQEIEHRLREVTFINKSLSTLGKCITSLSLQYKSNNNNNNNIQNNYNSHIPFRDSKLTRILQDSLGGNSKCLFIVTISQSELYIEETLSTLKFAQRARKVTSYNPLKQISKDQHNMYMNNNNINMNMNIILQKNEKYKKENIQLKKILEIILDQNPNINIINIHNELKYSLNSNFHNVHNDNIIVDNDIRDGDGSEMDDIVMPSSRSYNNMNNNNHMNNNNNNNNNKNDNNMNKNITIDPVMVQCGYEGTRHAIEGTSNVTSNHTSLAQVSTSIWDRRTSGAAAQEPKDSHFSTYDDRLRSMEEELLRQAAELRRAKRMLLEVSITLRNISIAFISH